MNAIMSQGAGRTALSTLAALALAAALPSSASAQSVFKIDVWTVDMAKSKFGPATGTLVLVRSNAAPELDAKGYPVAHSFLVVSNGKLYLATDDPSGSGAKNVAYTRWAGMKLSQIGNQVRSADLCSFRCQSGLADNRPMTITFRTTGATADAMRGVNVLAFDKR